MSVSTVCVTCPYFIYKCFAVMEKHFHHNLSAVYYDQSFIICSGVSLSGVNLACSWNTNRGTQFKENDMATKVKATVYIHVKGHSVGIWHNSWTIVAVLGLDQISS